MNRADLDAAWRALANAQGQLKVDFAANVVAIMAASSEVLRCVRDVGSEEEIGVALELCAVQAEGLKELAAALGIPLDDGGGEVPEA